MKKYILLISAALIMAGCSKKNDPAPPITITPATAKAADLVGKWTVTADTLFSSTSNQYSVNPVNGGTYYQFNNDGTCTVGPANNGTGLFVHYTVNNAILELITLNSSGGVAGSEALLIYAISKNSLGLRHNNNNNTYEDAWFTK
jgi:PBP1b-binding outer membrane lipoprotein LpoB